MELEEARRDYDDALMAAEAHLMWVSVVQIIASFVSMKSLNC